MSPYDRGYYAYYAGAGVEDNPFTDRGEYRDWHDGWCDAEDASVTTEENDDTGY